MSERDLARMRNEYATEELRIEDLAADPFAQFAVWFSLAVERDLAEPNAMVLSTTDGEGRSRARTVLLKGFDANGFTFFTNRASQKGRDLAGNPYAAIVFPWYPLQRQVKAWGTVEQTTDDESDEYFAVRPAEAQIGAWASEQSTEVASRTYLEERYAAFAERFGDGPIPRPPHWGGYRLRPLEVEFWQGGKFRLHDRLVYRLDVSAGAWRVARLAP